jgi:hypothetical protein
MCVDAAMEKNGFDDVWAMGAAAMRLMAAD